jgi:murein DD-endopeptidase MepM/ murein hydrolase activator NlpD
VLQKLILPYKSCKVVAGYKRPAYRSYWGYDHYGCDYVGVSNLDIIASGNGTVLTAGYDNNVGNTVCILYPDAYNHKTGKTQSLIARYMHLKSISVKVGQKVKAGDKIGVEGATGRGNWSSHLHIEFDTDTKWPNYSPQVAGANLIKKGIDSTVNPSHVFHKGRGQSISNYGTPNYTVQDDWMLPEIAGETVTATEFDALAKLYDALMDDHRILQADYDELAKLHDAAVNKLEQAKKDIAALAQKWKV